MATCVILPSATHAKRLAANPAANPVGNGARRELHIGVCGLRRLRAPPHLLAMCAGEHAEHRCRPPRSIFAPHRGFAGVRHRENCPNLADVARHE
jgi:hypothetical protein